MSAKGKQFSKVPVKGKKVSKLRPKTIQIPEDVMVGLEEHAYSNLEAEVGGMLFGTIQDGVASVAGAIPAAKATAEQISLTFTHEVWDDILSKGAEFFPGKQIVGWYHTHPSFGLFLSDYDQFIQNNFFSIPGQFALVIDPIAGNLGWFERKKNGQIILLAEENTKTGPKAAAQSAQAQATGIDLTKTIVFATSTAIIGGFIGFGLAAMNVPVDLSQTVAQLQFENDLLSTKEGRLDKQVAIYYLVKQGETAESVAKFFFGDKDRTTWILQHNPALEGKAENIKPGVEILIVAPVGMDLYQPFMDEIVPENSPEPSASASPEVSPKPENSISPTPSEPEDGK